MRIHLPRWLKRSKRPTPPQEPVRSRSWIYSSITVTICAGSHVADAIEESIRLARDYNVVVTFEANGVLVTVAADSESKLILRDWDRARNGYIDKKVGPYPNPVLTDEEERRRRVEIRMANAPAMEFSDEEGWQKTRAANTSPYGSGIMDYAERWARLMQLEMAKGKTLDEVWEDTLFEADLEGLSSTTRGVATHLLTQYWVHGAELRQLHNARWGVSDMSHTIKPAVVGVDRSN